MGVAGKYLISEREQESSIYGLLFFEWGWPEAVAQLIDDLGGWICLLAATIVGLNLFFDVMKGWTKSRGRLGLWFARLELPILGFVSFWFFALATAEMIRGGVFAEWAIPEQAVRFVTPLALLFSLLFRFRDGSRWQEHWIAGMLRLSIGATFAVHGFKAIVGYGPFIDLILLSDPLPWFGEISQSTAERILWMIGWVDVVLAVVIMFVRSRWIALYMAFWGFLTAGSRMLALGVDAWPESLIRVANGGAPLALVFLFQFLKQVKMAGSTCLTEDLTEVGT